MARTALKVNENGEKIWYHMYPMLKNGKRIDWAMEECRKPSINYDYVEYSDIPICPDTQILDLDFYNSHLLQYGMMLQINMGKHRFDFVLGTY